MNRSYIKNKTNKIQTKYHKLGSYKINETSLSSYNYKKYIFQYEYSRLSYFHESTPKPQKKCNFVKYRQFILIFPVVGTAILLTTFPTLLKSYFLLNNITRDYSNKWKIKKQKLKIITRPIQKNYKKNCDNIV